MAYATVADIQARMTRALTADEQSVCSALLCDAGAIIDAYNSGASAEVKTAVSCRMIIRSLSLDNDIPMGATQGSVSGLGYAQSWTISSGGAVGELYLSKTDKRMLGAGNKIGSYSPVEELASERYDSNAL